MDDLERTTKLQRKHILQLYRQLAVRVARVDEKRQEGIAFVTALMVMQDIEDRNDELLVDLAKSRRLERDASRHIDILVSGAPQNPKPYSQPPADHFAVCADPRAAGK